MANHGMKKLRERRKKVLEQGYEQDKAKQVAQVREDAESDKDEQVHRANVPETDVGEQDNAPNSRTKSADDFDGDSEPLRRLKGKVSALEKRSYHAEREAQAAKQRAAELEAELEAARKRRADQPEQDKRGEHISDKDLEQEMIDELGQEAWDYLDDGQKRVHLATLRKTHEKARRTEKKADSQSADDRQDEDDIDKRIERRLSERDKAARKRRFIRELDEAVDGGSFAEIVNSDDFGAWLNASRKRSAIFANAAEHHDEEAKNDLLELIGAYQRKDGKTSNATPTTRNPARRERKAKKAEVTYAQYQKALKDKRHPTKRKAANEVIAAYKKQLE